MLDVCQDKVHPSPLAPPQRHQEACGGIKEVRFTLTSFSAAVPRQAAPIAPTQDSFWDDPDVSSLC